MNKTLQYYNHPQVELQKSIWVNISGNNTGAILKDGKLYTTSGNNSYYSNATTGRGLNGQNPFYGVDNFGYKYSLEQLKEKAQELNLQKYKEFCKENDNEIIKYQKRSDTGINTQEDLDDYLKAVNEYKTKTLE